MKAQNSRTNSANSKSNFSRNRSFGDGSSGGFSSPSSPKKRGNPPARRSKSHDGSKLRDQLIADDDGFTAIGSIRQKPGGGGGGGSRGGVGGGGRGGGPGRFSNENNRRNNNNTSITRPRSTDGFKHPRPTGSFKQVRDNNRGSANNLRPNSSSNSLDGFPSENSSSDMHRTRSFNKPQPAGSLNNSNRSDTNLTTIGTGTAAADSAQAKRERFMRSTSRLTEYDVELFTQGDGKSQAQRSVIRLNVDVLMRARLSYMDPPAFGQDSPNGDTWNPHPKCLWNDPTRREQLEQVMTKYPNAIPLHLKKRTRIKSSKLGDVTSPPALTMSSSIVLSEDGDNSDLDDSSLATTSNIIVVEQISDACFDFSGQEDMNPLRKTLLLLNKLSWTTIDKLTPKLFEILEIDIPNLMATPSSSVKAETPSADTTKAASQQDNSENSEGNDSSKKDNNKKAAAPTPELSPMVITILSLIVEKAQFEPHFSAMYAQLCKNLAERNMGWRRKILAHCQLEFEHDIAWHTTRLEERLEEKANRVPMDDGSSTTSATEDMDRDYQVLQLRKRYLGHVQFIGELFKLNLIKLDIMIWCLSRLLFHKEQVDEDDLECFAKLMTVVGAPAQALVKKGKCHAVAEEKWYQCWDRIYWLTGRTKKASAKRQQGQPTELPPKISSRIKFMLTDLLELEENDWVHRRQHEKPKTIAEIHKQVREEEAEARRRSYSDDWSGPFGGRRRVNSDDHTLSPGYDKPRKVVDSDGFTEIPKRTVIVRRTVSDVDVSELYNKENSSKKKKPPLPVPASPTSRSRTVVSQIHASNATPKIKEYPDLQECKDKAKTILKEYFVGGDTHEAILSIDELVGAVADTEDLGSVERGAAVIESGVLLVMEMKQQEVQKFLAVVKRCLEKKKIKKESLQLGLNDPLEFLSDIEIDAPLARLLLTSVVSYWVRQDALPFSFLLNAPEYFRTDGKPAEFAASVLKMRGDAPSEDDLAVIEKLMTEEDKKAFSSPRDMLVLRSETSTASSESLNFSPAF